MQERRVEVAVDFGAQSRDMDVDHVGLRIEMIVPDMFEQHGPRDDLAGVLHEIFEQAKLSRLQRDFLSRARHLVGETIEHEIVIMEQEAAHPPRAGVDVRIPQFMKDILAQITFEARASNEINQSSGVSVRVTINNFESAISNAEKRAVRNAENEIVPRISDLHSLYASTAGKIELEYVGEDKKEDDLIERLINRAVLKVFDKYLKLDDLKKVSSYFEQGWGVEVSDSAPSSEYMEPLREVAGLREVITLLGPFETPGLMAAASEFIFEGLHLHQKLNKDRQGGRFAYHA